MRAQRKREGITDLKDTITSYDDSYEYVLTSNGHGRIKSYGGEMCAPIPPDFYNVHPNCP